MWCQIVSITILKTKCANRDLTVFDMYKWENKALNHLTEFGVGKTEMQVNIDEK